MDCITFNKDIDSYIEGKLDDEELNDFLHHFLECKSCAEELEINYIIKEGIDKMDKGGTDLNLAKSFKETTQSSMIFMIGRKHMITLCYIVITIVFWLMLCVTFIFIRMLATGAFG